MSLKWMHLRSSSGKGVDVMWYSRCRLSGDVIQSSSQKLVWLVEGGEREGLHPGCSTGIVAESFMT